MHEGSPLVEARIERFVRERLRPAVYARTEPLTLRSWIVRLYEAHGGQASATLSTASDTSVDLRMRAFQLVTLRFRDPVLPKAGV